MKIPSNAKFEDLAGWLETAIAEAEIPGAALGIVDRNVAHTAYFGASNVDTGDPVGPTTAFRIASLSKIFTATALVAAVDRGLLRLGDPLVQHLPEFSVADQSATATVTPLHLLTHSGGWDDSLEPEEESIESFVGRLKNSQQLMPPGTAFSYNNSGFIVAGQLLATLLATSYEEALASTVLRPAGMTNTGFTLDDISTHNVAHGHMVEDGNPQPIDPWGIPESVNPAGGLLSTLDDMLAFVRLHTSPESGWQGSTSEASLRSMQRPHAPGGTLGPVVADNIGLGWMLREFDGATVAFSEGSDAGVVAAMAFSPSHEFGIVVLLNKGDDALWLANDTVFKGVSQMTGLRMPEPPPVSISPESAGALSGTYELPGWLRFDVEWKDDRLNIATSAGPEILGLFSGPIIMTGHSSGYVNSPAGKLWIDFVPNDDSSNGWLRFAGRLAQRAPIT